MRVVSIVFNNFKNDSRVLKECRSLSQKGYQVTVVALHEEGLPEEENIFGIKVHRVKLKTRKYSKNLFMQMVKFIELGIKIVKKYRTRTDIIHCNDILPLPLAVLLKRFSKGKIKIVYDAHEYQTETQKLQGSPIRKKLVYLTEKFCIKRVDQVLTVSNGIAEEYQRIYNISKPTLVLNCPYYRTPQKENRFRERFKIESQTKILLYQGALTSGRGLEKLIDAFVELQQENLALIFMGYGALHNNIKEASKSYPGIYYQEAVPPDEVLTYTASADIGISLIEDSCLNYYYCLPNKLFEYAMAGLPIIVSPLPEMKKVVENYQSGVVAKDISTKGFAEAIESLLDKDLQKISSHSLKMAQKYNWEVQENKLFEAYENLSVGRKETRHE